MTVRFVHCKLSVKKYRFTVAKELRVVIFSLDIR